MEVMGSECWDVLQQRVSKVLKSEGFNGELREMLQELMKVTEGQRSRNDLGLWISLLGKSKRSVLQL